jgi:CheY-like chemotaxis protein
LDARVLVVDADRESRELLLRVLVEAGYAAVGAGGAEAARETRSAPGLELVLLDLELPGDAAWPLIEELSRSEARPSVVGIGGRAALETLLRGVHAGVGGFVARPVHLGDMLRTCHRVLGAGLSESGRAVAVAELLDLSTSGARFLLLAPFETGSRVNLSLEPRLAGDALSLVGDVRWCSPTASGWAHGIEFAGLTDAVRERLAELLPPDEPGAPGEG